MYALSASVNTIKPHIQSLSCNTKLLACLFISLARTLHDVAEVQRNDHDVRIDVKNDFQFASRALTFAKKSTRGSHTRFANM